MEPPHRSDVSAEMYNPSSSSLVTPALVALTESDQKQVDGAAFDYFIIEASSALRQSSAVALERHAKRERELVAAGLIAPIPPRHQALRKDGTTTPRDSIGSVKGPIELEDGEEALRMRLENIGNAVGGNLAERLCRNRARFTDTLDVIKFICKDFWSAVWEKPVDNLRTNHRGVYVLHDNAFRPVLRLSSSLGAVDALQRAKLHLAFPAGLVKGALARLGLQGVVIPETATLPQCTFQIKLPKGA